MAAAFAAAMASDQLWFHLGRQRGAASRFLWGMRIALPLAVGMRGMSVRRYSLLDALSAAAWSVVVGWLGYAASQLLATVAANIHRRELLIVVILGLCAACPLLVRWASIRKCA